MTRYEISTVGMGEINIDVEPDGEWVRYEDVKRYPNQPSCLCDGRGGLTIDDLRKAFEAGRTVLNYKGEWQETYNDNYTSSKYEKFEDWLKDYN